MFSPSLARGCVVRIMPNRGSQRDHEDRPARPRLPPSPHATHPCMRMRLRLASLVAALLLASPARAHDYWLEFQPLQPTVGSELAVSSGSARTSSRDRKTVREGPLRRPAPHHQRRRRRPPPDRTRRRVPILRLKLAAPGGHLLAARAQPGPHPAARPQVQPLPRARGPPSRARAAPPRPRAPVARPRAIHPPPQGLRADRRAADGVSTKVLGQRIELVPDRDLATPQTGERFGVVVLFEGKPLAGPAGRGVRRVPAGPRGVRWPHPTPQAGSSSPISDTPGAWLVRTLHMQRCIGCDGADWESFWAGYSFAVR
jgi:hypothetical protein